MSLCFDGPERLVGELLSTPTSHLVLTDDPDPPAAFPDGSRDQLGRSDQLRGATWLVRGLRERARTYEAVVRAIVELRPQIASAHDPKAVAPVSLIELATRSHLALETVSRSASGLRFQTPETVVSVALMGERLAFRRA